MPRRRSLVGVLPDGRPTTSAHAYAREWRKLATDVESVLGLGLVPSGYEPGITFHRPRSIGGSSVLHLPTDVCLAIAAHAGCGRARDAERERPASRGRSFRTDVALAKVRGAGRERQGLVRPWERR